MKRSDWNVCDMGNVIKSDRNVCDMKGMKRRYFCVGAVLFAIALTGCTINRPQEVTRKITVNGSGTVNVDQTVLTFTVSTRDIEMSVANKNNSEISEKVNEAVKAAGIESRNVSSAVTSSTEKGAKIWVKLDNGEWVGKEDYTVVTNKISVTVENAAMTKNLKDAILAKAGNGVVLSNVSYVPGDTASCLRQARALAVQTAQDSANLLAGASGCKINKVLEIVEAKPSYNKINVKSLVSETLPGTVSSITEGSISVQADVTVTYQLMD